MKLSEQVELLEVENAELKQAVEEQEDTIAFMETELNETTRDIEYHKNRADKLDKEYWEYAKTINTQRFNKVDKSTLIFFCFLSAWVGILMGGLISVFTLR